MAAGGSWKGLVLVLLLTGVSRAHAAPGDVVWSDSRLPGRATAGVLARQGLVVVSSADPSAPGLVIRIYDPADGTLRREHVIDKQVTPARQALIRGGMVIVLVRKMLEKPAPEPPAIENRLLAVHLATGRVRWQRSLGLHPEYDYPDRPVSIAAFGHRVYVSNEGGAALALDSRSGRVLWRDRREGVAAIAARRGQVMVVGSETPALGWPRLFVRMLDAESGRVRWEDEDDLGSPLGAFASTVAFADEHVVVGGWVNRTSPAYDGDYYDDPLLLAYDAQSGVRQWAMEAYLANDERVHRVLTHEGRVFALIDVKGSWRLEAHDAQSGSVVWQSELLLIDSAVAEPVITGDALYLACDPFEYPATLVAGGIEADDGAVGWTTAAEGYPIFYSASALAADDERLYVLGSAWDAQRGPYQAIWAHALR